MGPGTAASAAEPAAACRPESLVRFVSGGKTVESEVIRALDPCDDFGGNRAYTPAQHVMVYVNFNIAGEIDLDLIDQALARLEPRKREAYRRVDLAFVKAEWIERTYGQYDVVLNRARTTLFISEQLLEKRLLPDLWATFYQ